MSTLVIGGSGLLGGSIGFALAQMGGSSVSLSRARAPGFDTSIPFSKATDLADELASRNCELVINAMAVTSLSLCERDPEHARQVNGLWPQRWAQTCARQGVPFVQISTDAVFPGFEGDVYDEDSPAKPMNEYGRSKLEGEQRVLESNPDALVVRTNFFGWSNNGQAGILDFFHRNLESGRDVPGFFDYTTSSLYAGDVIDWLWKLVRYRASGLIHLTSHTPLSKLDFGRAVATEFGLSPEKVTPASKDSLEGRRASFLRLSSERAERLVGQTLPTTDSGIRRARTDRVSVKKHLEI